MVALIVMTESKCMTQETKYKETIFKSIKAKSLIQRKIKKPTQKKETITWRKNWYNKNHSDEGKLLGVKESKTKYQIIQNLT